MVNPENFRPLQGVRVIEFGDGLGSYAGRLLADSGAEVIKVEPPQGAASRSAGPFVGGAADPEQSLQFWHANASKQSIALDLHDPQDVATARALVASADVVLDGLAPGALQALGLGQAALRAAHSKLIVCAITPFGQDGPWANYTSSDLVQLAAGGLLSVCGYDGGDGPDTPVAPTGGQAAHIAGMTAMMAILAALIEVQASGEGQFIDVSAQASIAVSLEMGVPFWAYQQREVIRHTARHAMPAESPRWQHRCADGKYFLALPLYIDDARFAALVEWFDAEGLAEDLTDPSYQLMSGRAHRMGHIIEVIGRFCAKHDAATMFRESQARRLPWAPVNSPDEILADPHFSEARHTFADVADPATGQQYRFAKLPYLIGHADTTTMPPRLDQHGARLRGELQQNQKVQHAQ